MDANTRRRASRNFGVLVDRTIRVPLLLLISIGSLRMWLGWSAGRAWLFAAFWLFIAGAAAWEAMKQARKIRSFVPLGEAARLWLGTTRRALAGGRTKRPSPIWAGLLVLIVGGPIVLILLLPGFDEVSLVEPAGRADGAGSFRLLLLGAVYLLSIPPIIALLRRAKVDDARMSHASFAAWLALLPAILFLALASRWSEGRAFGAQPTVRETVLATVQGICSYPAYRIHQGTHFCITAQSSRGPVRWTSMMSLDAALAYRQSGRVCVRETLERSASGAFRLAHGAHRIGVEALVACPEPRPA